MHGSCIAMIAIGVNKARSLSILKILFMKINSSKLLVALLTLCVIFLLVKSFLFPGSSIAYVDSNKLLTGYNAMVQARAEFEKKQNVWKANIDSLTVEVQEAMKKYEKTA